MATFSLFNRFHRKIKSFFGGYIEHNHIDYQRPISICILRDNDVSTYIFHLIQGV